MMGVDLTAIPTVGPGTALVIASEIGPDFSAFPSAQHFCSWLALAPGTRISGGKNLPGKSPKAVNPVGQALRMAAMAARRSETFIGAKHRARLARMDTPVAIKATARELACLIYLMVTEGQKYVEQGIDAYEKRRLNRKFAHLDRQAQSSGSNSSENARRGKTEPNAVNRLGICYSRARNSEPYESRGIKGLVCRSASMHSAEQQPAHELALRRPRSGHAAPEFTLLLGPSASPDGAAGGPRWPLSPCMVGKISQYIPEKSGYIPVHQELVVVTYPSYGCVHCVPPPPPRGEGDRGRWTGWPRRTISLRPNCP